MRVVEEYMMELKKIEGRDDTPALVMREEIIQRIEEYMESKRRIRPIVEESFVVGDMDRWG